MGEALRKGYGEVEELQKRDCFEQLEKYLYGKGYGRVCVVHSRSKRKTQIQRINHNDKTAGEPKGTSAVSVNSIMIAVPP